MQLYLFKVKDVRHYEVVKMPFVLLVSSPAFINSSWCVSGEGTVQPALCPVGYYCPPGLTLGLEFPCPPGTMQSQLGASGAEACLPCPAGMERISVLFYIIIT